MAVTNQSDLEEVTVDVLQPFHFTGFLIRRAQQHHVAAWQREVSAEISSVQFGVLSVLARRPGASQRDLCDELDLDRSTIAEVVARLLRRGLVVRERHDSDRRRNALHLSARGQTELDRLLPHVEDVERVLTGMLTAPEREELRRLLSRILEGAQAPELRPTEGE